MNTATEHLSDSKLNAPPLERPGKKIKPKSLLRRLQRQRKRQAEKTELPKLPKRLSIKQARLLEELPKHATHGQAALAAGYKTHYPSQMAHQALNSIARKSPEIMKELGLDLRVAVDQHLRPLLTATDVRRDKYGGNYEVPDNPTRLRAVVEVIKLNNGYPKEELTDGQTPAGVIFRLELADDERAEAIAAAIAAGRSRSDQF
jgi:hypothetical protein